MLSMIGGGVE